MTYIVRQEVKGHPYYYLVKNVREEGAFRKYKRYLGSAIPQKKQLQKIEQELEIRARDGIRHVRPKRERPVFLTAKEKGRLKEVHHSTFEDEKSFVVQFSAHTNGIEGSTLDVPDTRKVIKDRIVMKNMKLREIYEAVNTEEAYEFIKNNEGDVSKRFLLRIHGIMMGKIIPDAGSFRTKGVKIVGANFHHPPPENLPQEIERLIAFYRFLKRNYHPVEVAALTHIKFIELHPFSDGNGRVGRLLLNFILMKNDLPLIIVRKNERKTYYRLLDKAITDKDYVPFVRFVYSHVIMHS